MPRLWRCAVLVSCLVPSALVYADVGIAKSEYFHQADPGKFELNAGFGREPEQTAWTTQDANGVQSTTTPQSAASNVTPISLGGEYGLSPSLALGLDLIYGTGVSGQPICYTASVCPPQSASGLFNPNLYLKGRYGSDHWALIYGAHLDLGIQKANAAGSSYSYSTGGTTVTPYVGFQSTIGASSLGVRVQYDVYKSSQGENVTDSTGAPVTGNRTGGQRVSADVFYEADLGSYTLGGSAFALFSPETTTSVDGNSASDANAFYTWGLQLYIPVRLPGWTLLPTIAYEQTKYTESGGNISSATTYQMGLSARFNF